MGMMRGKYITDYVIIMYLLKIDTFRNIGAYSSGSSVTSVAFSISFLAYSSASLGVNDQMNF